MNCSINLFKDYWTTFFKKLTVKAKKKEKKSSNLQTASLLTHVCNDVLLPNQNQRGPKLRKCCVMYDWYEYWDVSYKTVTTVYFVLCSCRMDSTA